MSGPDLMHHVSDKPALRTSSTRSMALVLVLEVILSLGGALTAAADPSVYPTGTTRYEPAKAFDSFVLFTGGDNVVHLIDLDGNSVHEWKDAGGFSTLIDPALTHGEFGHVLVTLATQDGSGTHLVPGQVAGRISKTIGELDWDGQTGRLFQVTPTGEIVWEYVNPYFRHGNDAAAGDHTVTNQVYRAQPVPFEWVPEATPHSEKAVVAPDPSRFRVPSG